MSDGMRSAFKYWKRKKPPPEFQKALDLHTHVGKDIFEPSLNGDSTSRSTYEKFGLKPPEDWNVYAFENNKGLIYIKNPFSPDGQRYWIVRCLRDFPKKPHKLNIDAHEYLKNDEDWWTASHDNNYDKAHHLLKSLRWATLGYHHDWDTKLYTEENRHEFPPDLGEMCKLIASRVGFENYLPQASIVNYYHMDSTLAPHTDHSEKNLDAPLISISFGQSAIFLIGNNSEDVEPTALYLHSGDIVIMSKDSRLCYHAVPRIVQSAHESWSFEIDNDKDEKKQNEHLNSDIYDPEFWKPFSHYLNTSRININVRQVLFNNQNCLDDVR